MSRCYLNHVSGILLVLNTITLNAAPVIEVDNKTYECGKFTEGKDETAIASFKIRNSGDTVLRIESVRPGCGCVVAAYDTLIPPGKSGNIKLEAKLKGYSGKFGKTATVTSNAKNEPSIRLTMKATVLPIITVSKQYIALPLLKDKKTDNLYLSSLKKDLMVTGITFKLFGQNNSQWHDQLSLPIMYEWSRIDSISPDSFTVFLLLMKSPELKESLNGEFILTTNHPDKKQIQINGRIGNE